MTAALARDAALIRGLHCWYSTFLYSLRVAFDARLLVSERVHFLGSPTAALRQASVTESVALPPVCKGGPRWLRSNSQSLFRRPIRAARSVPCQCGSSMSRAMPLATRCTSARNTNARCVVGPSTNPFRQEVLRRFGLVPNFFMTARDAPEIVEKLWDFAKSAYLDNPMPSLFKERLFVFLSRFCPVRYCIVRHCGFLVGYGHSSGDPAVPRRRLTKSFIF